ncbi:uncharacterized protein LOC100898210 [Galendromus occidentalis]|uniref:Elongator complex protein 5 n=1 Tax=Galendromus occidentalis TaxID=34638 RepID=A0AAJ6QSM4_9ACAR|nr:uncharacterized protein LOC100898210 [Galendromus occidentalis]
MANHFLNAEDIRGLFLMIDDCRQNILAVISTYREKLREKGYNVHIINPSRPDIMESGTIAPPFWPPNFKVSQPKSVLILHSLELLQALADVDFQTLFKQLINWLALPTVSQIVVSVNRESMSTGELETLEYLCSQKLELLERNGNDFKVESLWKKPRGKALVQKEIVVIQNSRLVKCSVVNDPVLPAGARSQPASILADLTFNVNITGDEQKDKDKLVLPYTEAGQITYTLDREDDFDEEDDPDDDLDI